MDGCPNEPAAIHSLSRKRKADPDAGPAQQDHDDHDDQVPPPGDQQALVLSATPRIPSKLLPPHPNALIPPWQRTPAVDPRPVEPAFAAVQVSQEGPSKPKRPRIEIPTTIPQSQRRLRRVRTPYTTTLASPRRYARHPRLTEIRDTGVVSAIEPRRLGLSVLCSESLSPSLSSSSHRVRTSRSVPVTPIDSSSPSAPHVPPHQPPINRITLKELDLEAILRNPQLRHDLLFDPGLQFRPTFSRRKRDIADTYWTSVLRELETGCTCTTCDADGKLRDRACVCKTVPLPKHRPIRVYTRTGEVITLRSPSRLKPLLCELLEVLISIIQPPATQPAGLSLRPQLLHPQYQQNSSHIAYLRSILDADLIQQELEHGLFDPSGLFQAVGDIIRCYCAPMRDHVVDQMVTLAKSCAPGGTGSKTDAVRAIRQCFEVMELMKLDVANHQLQSLRPFLVHSAAQFELQMFQENRQQKGGPVTLAAAQHWLQAAFDELAAGAAENNVAVGGGAKGSPVLADFARYPRATQIQIAVTRAVVNLIFDYSIPLPSSSSSGSSASSSSSSSSSPASTPPATPASESPRFPETLYLDRARLSTLRTDAADFTALYMMIMLFRQLVHSASPSPSAARSRVIVKPDDLVAVKKEVWEVGPAHLGSCYLSAGEEKDKTKEKGKEAEKDNAKWREELASVVLQLTVRATEARTRSGAHIPTPTSATPAIPTSTAIPTPTQTPTLPDSSLLKLATSWTDSNLRPESALSTLMKRRVRKVVEDTTLALLVTPLPPPRASTSTQEQTQGQTQGQQDTGLEPLMPEIRHLAEKLRKLVGIHLSVYGTLYAQPGFLSPTGST